MNVERCVVEILQKRLLTVQDQMGNRVMTIMMTKVSVNVSVSVSMSMSTGWAHPFAEANDRPHGTAKGAAAAKTATEEPSEIMPIMITTITSTTTTSTTTTAEKMKSIN